MKKLTALFIFICLAQITYADYWTQKADFPGLSHTGNIAFSIGAKGYIGIGKDSANTNHNDLWEYQPASNTWTQMASFPGSLRTRACSFVINSKGYVGCGESSTYLFDFYEFDPAANSWTSKASYPGLGTIGCATFSLGQFGFVGGGRLSTSWNQDFWKYDSANDSWSQIASLPSNGRDGASAFTIGNYAYVGLGTEDTYYLQDYWKYDLVSNLWIQIFNPGLIGERKEAVSFSINQFGYVCCGYGSNLSPAIKSDMWQYDSQTDAWTQKTSFPGYPRPECSGFSINNKGYCGIGVGSGSTPAPLNYSDWWEYTPDSTTSISDLQSTNYDLQITPNPAKDFIKITIGNKQQKASTEKITIADVSGKIVYTSTITSNEMVIDVKHFAKGVYTVSVGDGKQSVIKKFLKE